MSAQVSCPGCGAAVEFKIGSSLVKICEYCRSVVARADRDIKDLGKVAALVDTDSYLEVGRSGVYQGKRYLLTGRAQLRHSAGGVWDEWYASFDGDQWGWLAEAQGRYYLTFREPVADGGIPHFEELQLGQDVPASPLGGYLTVAEKGEATYVAAEGEIPYFLQPGISYPYADLSGPGGTFATLDYGDEEPVVFYGHEVSLEELGIAKRDLPRRQARQVEGHHLSCPNCGGALELRAPDRSERVVCPNCHSLLDCTQGTLQYLQTLEASDEPLLPIGSVGKLAEGEFTVIGLIERYVTEEGINYYWQEYLLYQAGLGFRWLVRNQNHWNYVRPLTAGDIQGRGHKVSYQGRKFKIFQKGDAVVSYVLGECYWKVQIGETVASTDYICAPEMLSREMSVAGASLGDGDLAFAIATVVPSGEINWSLGTYLPKVEVEKAFGLKEELPAPRGIAPNQPFGYKNIYSTWALLASVLFLVAILVVAISPERALFTNKAYEIKREAVFTEPFELRARENIEVSVEMSGLYNCWVGLAGDFVNEETGDVQPFFLECESYQGSDSDGLWREGNHDDTTVLSALPAGKYVLRLETEPQPWMDGRPDGVFKLTVRQGVPHWSTFFWALFWVSALPLGVLAYHLVFEYQRWKDSEYSPFRSSED